MISRDFISTKRSRSISIVTVMTYPPSKPTKRNLSPKGYFQKGAKCSQNRQVGFDYHLLVLPGPTLLVGYHSTSLERMENSRADRHSSLLLSTCVCVHAGEPRAVCLSVRRTMDPACWGAMCFSCTFCTSPVVRGNGGQEFGYGARL